MGSRRKSTNTLIVDDFVRLIDNVTQSSLEKLLVGDINQHRDPELKNEQTVRDHENSSLDGTSVSNLSSYYSGIYVEEETNYSKSQR